MWCGEYQSWRGSARLLAVPLLCFRAGEEQITLKHGVVPRYNRDGRRSAGCE